MPMIHEMMPPMMQPATAVFGPFAEKTRAWKSRAARLPKPRTKIVTQLKKIALGIGSIASGSVIWLGSVRTSPIG